MVTSLRMFTVHQSFLFRKLSREFAGDQERPTYLPDGHKEGAAIPVPPGSCHHFEDTSPERFAKLPGCGMVQRLLVVNMSEDRPGPEIGAITMCVGFL